MNPLLLTLAILHSGDAVTTGAILARNGSELNPALPQSAPINLLVQAGETAGTAYLLSRLNRQHPKLAKTLAFGAIAAESIALGHNLKSLRRGN